VLDVTPHPKVELLLAPFTRSGIEVDPTLEAVERDDIIHVLKKVNGKVAGRDGARDETDYLPIMLTACGTFRESQYCAPLESGAA
jgi:hypothetical protein